MRLIRPVFIGTVAIVIFTLSCRRGAYNEGSELEAHPVHRLDRVLMDYRPDSGIRPDDSLYRPLSFLAGILSSGSPVDSVIAGYAASYGFTAFVAPVCERLPDLDSIECVLGKVDSNLAEYLPDVSLGEVYGIIFPYNQAIVQSDSIVLVALNHYLGADFEGYGYFEPYQRRTKSTRLLPYDLVEARLAYMYPEVAPDGDRPSSVLNAMLYHGAMTEAKMRLVPDATEGDALGYDAGQMQWAADNEANIWNALITRKLLYSTSIMDVERLMAPSPRTSIIHNDAPGRLGRYVGYRIVRSYMDKHPDTSLSYLLSPEFYNGTTTLIDAGYVPR